MENMSSLKAARLDKQLTQRETAQMLGISLRSYKTYENDASKVESFKYRHLLRELESYNPIDEEHGILTTKQIQKITKPIFDRYEVRWCILFGSYSKATSNEKSDVDLLVSTDATGFQFYGLVEDLRVALHKRVDLLDSKNLHENPDLLAEILKDGIRIYATK